jgi:hypothetical protein
MKSRIASLLFPTVDLSFSTQFIFKTYEIRSPKLNILDVRIATSTERTMHLSLSPFDLIRQPV